MSTPEIKPGQGGRPVHSEHKISNDQAIAMRARAHCSEQFTGSTIRPPPEQARVPTPLNSDDEDESMSMSEEQKRMVNRAKKMATRASTQHQVTRPTETSHPMVSR
jgi:hypothetical protein